MQAVDLRKIPGQCNSAGEEREEGRNRNGSGCLIRVKGEQEMKNEEATKNERQSRWKRPTNLQGKEQVSVNS